ncbi:hypothetical protein QFZ98_000551 [Paraburkholderia youngii]
MILRALGRPIQRKMKVGIRTVKYENSDSGLRSC